MYPSLRQAAEQAAGRLLASGEQHDTLREQLQEVVQRGEALLAQVGHLQKEKDQLASTIKDRDKELKKAQQVQQRRFCSLRLTA